VATALAKQVPQREGSSSGYSHLLWRMSLPGFHAARNASNRGCSSLSRLEQGMERSGTTLALLAANEELYQTLTLPVIR
jgi:hypothetical protein